MYNDLIKTQINNTRSLFQVNDYTIDALLVLIHNSRSVSSVININVSFDLSLWFNDFLIKYINNIKIVTNAPKFDLYSYSDTGIIVTGFECKTLTFKNDNEIDNFFISNYGRVLVFYSIGKFINLKTMDITYTMRYVDITNKKEDREIKINNIIKN